MRELSTSELASADWVRQAFGDFAVVQCSRHSLEAGCLPLPSSAADLMSSARVHDFSVQPLGEERQIEAVIHVGADTATTDVVLARRSELHGQPSLVSDALLDRLTPDDVFAVAAEGSKLHLIRLADVVAGTVAENVHEVSDNRFDELVSRLRVMGEQWTRAHGRGPRAVSDTLANLLGLAPDGKSLHTLDGLLVRIRRGTSAGRADTLFAATPDWDSSGCADMTEFTIRYGYERNGVPTLMCSVGADTRNGFGMRLRYDVSSDAVQEFHDDDPGFTALQWSGEALRTRLREKYASTAWLDVEGGKSDDGGTFRVVRATLSGAPMANQFGTLIQSGVVWLDHMTEIRGSRAHERGRIFRIKQRDAESLFPTITTVRLNRAS